MPLFNGEEFVAEAIESILAESYQNFELLICDDASTDQSLSIAQKYAARDPRIRLSIRERNSGSISLVTRGLIAHSRGTYLIVSDSDDVAMPGRLETLVTLAENNPQSSVVYGTVHSVSEDLKTLLKVYDTPFCPFRLFRNNFIPDGGSLIRKTAYDAVNGYDQEVVWAEDYELRLRLATVGPMIHRDELTYLYRQHGSSWTAEHLNRNEEKTFKEKILQREKSVVERISHGQINSYRDAVIASYYLASVAPSFPCPSDHGFPRLLSRCINRTDRLKSPLVRRITRKTIKPLLGLAATAWKRNRLVRPTITGAMIGSALQAAGLETGDQTMVHCAMSSLGWVSGGAPTVLEALTTAVGDQGRIVMPTFTYQCDLGSTEPSTPPPASRRYHEDQPCSPEMGIVAETFRRRPDTHRINHPGLSLTVWGKDARNFAAQHHNFDSFSPSSPMGNFYQQGKIVMIGTDFETITSLHLAEYLAAVPYQDYHHFYGVADDQNPVTRLRTTGASAAFTKFTGLLSSGHLRTRTIPLGNSHITVIQAPELVNFAAKVLRYLPDFVLGTESTSCRERRLLAASKHAQ